MRKATFQLIVAALFTLSPVSADAGDDYTEALTRVQQGKFEQAEQLLEPHAETAGCRDPRIYHLLATCRTKLGRNVQALLTVEQGLERCGPDSELEGLHAWLIRTVLPVSESESRLRELVSNRPKSPHYRKALAQVLMRYDPYLTETEGLLTQAIKLSPSDFEAQFLYGQWCCLNNRDEDCVRILRRALRLNPGNEQASMQAYTMIALAQEALGRIERAREAFRLAEACNLRLPSPSPITSWQRVQFLEKYGPAGEAKQELRELLARAPHYAPALLQRAKSLSREGKHLEAVEVATEALQNAVEDPREQRPIHIFLAKTLFLLKRADEAKVHQEWIRDHP